MSIKGMWKRAKDFLTGAANRVRALFEELPEARELVAELNAEALLRFGDEAAALEPQDSRLVRAIVKVANLLDYIAPMSGLGSDKERALVAKVRQVARLVGVADEYFDATWERRLRPELVRYIATKKAGVAS